jgi:hypothetical protein
VRSDLTGRISYTEKDRNLNPGIQIGMQRATDELCRCRAVRRSLNGGRILELKYLIGTQRRSCPPRTTPYISIKSLDPRYESRLTSAFSEEPYSIGLDKDDSASAARSTICCKPVTTTHMAEDLRACLRRVGLSP